MGVESAGWSDNGVKVLRDGGILGGTSFFYFTGIYSCSGGRRKGTMTHQEHNPAPQTYYPMARRIVTLGFTGNVY